MNIDLECLAREFKVFVDTCSFMHPEAPGFFYKQLAPILLRYEQRLIISQKVKIEIEKLQKSKEQETADSARCAAEIMRYYSEHKLIDVRGERGDPFADNVFYYVFSKFRTRYDLALLTQDKGLAMDILTLRSSQAVRSSKKLLVLRLDRKGKLSEWTDGNNFESARKAPSESIAAEMQKFRLCSLPHPGKDRNLKTGALPGVGDSIDVGEIGPVRLSRVLGGGGEGTTFRTDSGHACKIYTRDRLTEHRLQKLTLMTDKKIRIPDVCWPLALARNSQKDFIGYLMPLADGIQMQKCLFVKPLLEKSFPNWSRRNLVQLAITWLEKVVNIHNLNVLIGDVNPLNFLIKSETEVFFVDTDSYQIEDFPCPVGMANFTAPEIQGIDFPTFLRTFEHEYFAIATLLFMILLPGKPPYSHQGGGDLTKNIKEGEFSYRLGDISNKKTPEGPWRFIWSHLPYKTKEAFFNCFVNRKRISPEQWLDLMRNYKYDLDKGHLDPDGESDKLFPTRFKGVSTYAQKTYNAEEGGWESFKCDICGNTFQRNAAQADKFRNSPRKLCHDCLEAQKMENTTGEMITCSDCGEPFLFSIGEMKFYAQKGLDPPKRCKQCRGNRTPSKSATPVPLRSHSPPIQGEKKSKKSNDSLWDILEDILKAIIK